MALHAREGVQDDGSNYTGAFAPASRLTQQNEKARKNERGRAALNRILDYIRRQRAKQMLKAERNREWQQSSSGID